MIDLMDCHALWTHDVLAFILIGTCILGDRFEIDCGSNHWSS